MLTFLGLMVSIIAMIEMCEKKVLYHILVNTNKLEIRNFRDLAFMIKEMLNLFLILTRILSFVASSLRIHRAPIIIWEAGSEADKIRFH